MLLHDINIPYLQKIILNHFHKKSGAIIFMKKTNIIFKGLKKFILCLSVILFAFPMFSIATGCNDTASTEPIPQQTMPTIAQNAVGGIVVSWPRVEGSVRYTIERAGSRLGKRTEIASVQSTTAINNQLSFTDNNPNPNRLQNYYFITAFNSQNRRIIIGLVWRPHTNTALYLLQHRSDSASNFATFRTVNHIVGNVVIDPQYHSTSPAVGIEGDEFRVIPVNAAGSQFYFQQQPVYIYDGVLCRIDANRPFGESGNVVHSRNQNRYNYIRQIFTQEISFERQLFGDNMLFYDAEFDDMQDIANEINRIHWDYLFSFPNSRERDGHFSFRRYSMNFKPGQYRNFGTLNIGYNTTVSGLGGLPTQTQLFGQIKTPSQLANGNATCTFWRSIENFEVNQASEDSNPNTVYFHWAVSQAAPARRMSVNARAQFCFAGHINPYTNAAFSGPWASGGFLADSRFTAPLGSPNQQQWYTRNSHFGHSEFSGDNWNRITHGVTGHPYVSNWHTGGARTNIELVPIVRERPFLFLDGDRYNVFVPGWRRNSEGISWSNDSMGDGEVLDLEDNFFIAFPHHTAAQINAQLANGKNIFFTPGWFDLEVPLFVGNPNAILLGTGKATLFPGANNQEGAIFVDDVPGVIVAGVMLDALYDSLYLIRLGNEDANANHSANPTILHDVIVRIGGYVTRNVNATVSVQINSNDVVGDHLWVWRGDHGNAIGWCPIIANARGQYANTGDWGLIVSGDRVTMYALFVEHYQKYETLWLGEDGNVFFYQNESPYDPTNQSVWMSRKGMPNEYDNLGNIIRQGETRGWASYKVANHVQRHTARNLGMYSVFNRTGEGRLQTEQVFMDNAIEVPHNPGVIILHAMITELSDTPGPTGSGANARDRTVNGTLSIVNGTGQGVTNRTIATARRLISFNYAAPGQAVLPPGVGNTWSVDLRPVLNAQANQPTTFPVLRIGVQPADECWFTLLYGLGQRLRPEWAI